MINIGGIVKFSSLDYPGALSAIVFCQGCPLRCTYCHNPNFQDLKTQGAIDFNVLLEFLKSRKGLLDAVVFSGGEPLLQYDLKNAICIVKDLGFKIGLHTSGAVPEQFEVVLPYLDWVGFDVKTDFAKYETITNVKNSGEKALESLKMLIKSGIKYEIRLTYDPRNITDADLINVPRGTFELGVKKLVIQECILRNDGQKIKLPLPSEKILTEMRKFLHVELRKE